jgi:Ca2+-binding EF-hand superfamily protein
LKHPFLRKCRRCAKADIYAISSARKSLETLEKFSSQHSKLKQATCAIMASQLLTQAEKDRIDVAFRLLDTSCDGQLDRGDLKRGYREYFDREVTDEEVDSILEHVNFSDSGVIEYSEFAIAVLMGQNKVDDDKLKAAFNLFDEDGKGHISAEDIKRALKLGDDQEKYLRKKILRQVDAEETGRIDFDEFKEIMHSTAAMATTKKKKKKRVSLKRSPRRAFVTSGLASSLSNIKVLHCTNLADGMDASELSNHSNWYGPQERRPYTATEECVLEEDLSEYENEDQVSGAIASNGL